MMTHFELCNNVIQLPNLAAFLSLKKLDMSINQLRTMAALSTLETSQLQELYLTSNKLSTIEVSLPLLQHQFCCAKYNRYLQWSRQNIASMCPNGFGGKHAKHL